MGYPFHFSSFLGEKTFYIRERPLMTSLIFWLFLTYLPTYPVLLYNVPFLGLFWTPLPTLIRDVINGRSLIKVLQAYVVNM